MIVQSALLMGSLGLMFAIFLAFAKRRFHVETDPRIEQVGSVLPGINCGGCGYPSCAAYAEAVAENGEAIDLCVVGGADTTRAIAGVMGVDVVHEERPKLVAVVFCQGTSEAAAFPGVYRGIPDCVAAVYSQDVAKRCKYGCVGLGSCVRSCPFDAIHIGDSGVPVVDAGKCTACGKCVVACPRDLIELHPIKHDAFVFCKSKDSPHIAKEVCKKACIGCSLCVKAAADDENPAAVRMAGNLAVVNTEYYTARPEYGNRCPTDSYTTRANIVNYQRWAREDRVR